MLVRPNQMLFLFFYLSAEALYFHFRLGHSVVRYASNYRSKEMTFLFRKQTQKAHHKDLNYRRHHIDGMAVVYHCVPNSNVIADDISNSVNRDMGYGIPCGKLLFNFPLCVERMCKNFGSIKIRPKNAFDLNI